MDLQSRIERRDLTAAIIGLGYVGLEWSTESPPPTTNFRQIPVVTEEAYAYAPGKRTQAEAH